MGKRKDVSIFILLMLMFVFASFPLEAQNKTSISTGRYILYYHPTNFNQAFLLDTATGRVWQLKFGTIETTEGEEQYPIFERVGVQGKYESSTEKLANRQRTEKFLKQMKDEAEEIVRKEKEKQAEKSEEIAKQEAIKKTKEMAVLEEKERIKVRLQKLSKAPLPTESDLRAMADFSNGSVDKFLNALNDMWPGYEKFINEFTFKELFQEIKNRYPQLASEFKELFEGTSLFELEIRR